MKTKLIKLYHNRYGKDECFAERLVPQKTSAKQCIAQLNKDIDFGAERGAIGDFVSEFELQIKSKNGKVYVFDGIGIYITKSEETFDALYKESLEFEGIEE